MKKYTKYGRGGLLITPVFYVFAVSLYLSLVGFSSSSLGERPTSIPGGYLLGSCTACRERAGWQGASRGVLFSFFMFSPFLCIFL